MVVPDFRSFLRALLEFATDERDGSLEEARDAFATRFELSQAEEEELLLNGYQRPFDNRVAWTKAHLVLQVIRLRNVPRPLPSPIDRQGG